VANLRYITQLAAHDFSRESVPSWLVDFKKKSVTQSKTVFTLLVQDNFINLIVSTA
jgi:hypothetical protein